MKLWLLRPSANVAKGDDPWTPWYDKAFGFIVRAETETAAREIAHAYAGDENRGEFLGKRITETYAPWKEAKYSTCVELSAEGPEGLMMMDFKSA